MPGFANWIVLSGTCTGGRSTFGLHRAGSGEGPIRQDRLLVLLDGRKHGFVLVKEVLIRDAKSIGEAVLPKCVLRDFPLCGIRGTRDNRRAPKQRGSRPFVSTKMRAYGNYCWHKARSIRNRFATGCGRDG